MEKEILELEKKAFFKLNSKEKKMFIKDFKKFKSKLSFIDEVEKYIENLEESNFPFEVYNSNLRSDELIENNSDNFSKNTTNFNDDYILLKGAKNEK